MKNIHLLPTNKPSRLHLVFKAPNNYDPHNKDLNIDRCKYMLYDKAKGAGKNIFTKHIYITSDEEIKEGNWCIDKHNTVYKQETDKTFTKFTGAKKIILTTDQDLIRDGVQAIDDAFLEWFVKNPSCESVEIYEGDTFYWLDKGLNIRNSGYTKDIGFPHITLYFSTKEKAEEYILMNKPCLNLNDIEHLLKDGSSVFSKLKELAKSKINQNEK